jgi:hypothetical protein
LHRTAVIIVTKRHSALVSRRAEAANRQASRRAGANKNMTGV